MTDWAPLREKVLTRCGGYCELCGFGLNDTFALHHRKLRSRGGKDTLDNLNTIIQQQQTIINDTMVGGATLTKLLGTSAWYAPGAAGAALVESIVRDEKKLFTCCVSLNGEYGQKDICLGVPVVIGKNGWEKIVEMDLSADEQAAFNKSADAVRNMNDVLKTL